MKYLNTFENLRLLIQHIGDPELLINSVRFMTDKINGTASFNREEFSIFP